MKNSLLNDFGTTDAIDSHIRSILEKFPEEESKAHKLALELQKIVTSYVLPIRQNTSYALHRVQPPEVRVP